MASEQESQSQLTEFAFNMHQFKSDITNNDKATIMRTYLQNLSQLENAKKFPMTFAIGYYKDTENVPQVSFIHRNFVNGQMKHLEEVLKELKATRNSFAIFRSYSKSSSEQPQHRNIIIMFMFVGLELPPDFINSDFYQGYEWIEPTFHATDEQHHENIISFSSNDSSVNFSSCSNEISNTMVYTLHDMIELK